MKDDRPDVIDAEFEVIEANQPPERRWHWPWEYRWTIDWRVFAIIALGALATLIADLTH